MSRWPIGATRTVPVQSGQNRDSSEGHGNGGRRTKDRQHSPADLGSPTPGHQSLRWRRTNLEWFDQGLKQRSGFVLVHGFLPSARSLSRDSSASARESRLLTVPGATPRTAAISCSVRCA